MKELLLKAYAKDPADVIMAVGFAGLMLSFALFLAAISFGLLTGVFNDPCGVPYVSG